MTRVLHVVGGMDRGGIETWLMHVLRATNRSRLAMDFLVQTARPCSYDDEARALGAKMMPCLRPARPRAYARNLRLLLREHGPYDVVHSHVHHFSGLVLRLARRAGVPVRIAHSHNDTTALDSGSSSLRQAYLRLMARWIDRHATAGLAASRQAAASLFGPAWESEARWRIHSYGLDLTPFRAPVDRDAVRAELGISGDAFVVGHVGRFVDQKNHRFLIEVAAEVVRREPRMRLLLVGEGELRPEIERLVARLGLSDRTILAGVRPDVPRLMRGAMDVFAFPSRFEGLGLVLVEAQAAGLPCVISDVIPDEADVVPGLVHRLALSSPASAWAETLLDARRVCEPAQSLGTVESSPFALHRTVAGLAAFYEASVGTAKAHPPRPARQDQAARG